MRSSPWYSTVAALVLGVVLLLSGSARAELHGGIEVGSTGVKATVVRVTPQTDGTDLKVEMGKSVNTTLVAGLAESGTFDAEALKDTVEQVGKFYSLLQSEHRVPVKNIYLVGSSGLVSALGAKKDRIQANQDLLADAVRKATGKGMDFITVEREIELSILGIVPPKQRGDALLLDIGGGNTKGGYCSGEKSFVHVSVPYGTKTFTEAVKLRSAKSQTPFPAQVSELATELLVPALKQQVEKQPGLATRERVYLSGGAVWALATLVRPADRSALVELTTADLDAFLKKLTDDPKSIPAADIDGITGKVARTEVTLELRRIKDTFNPQNLLAGATILKTMSQELDFARAGKKIYFARNGYLGWLLAYVNEQSGVRKE